MHAQWENIHFNSNVVEMRWNRIHLNETPAESEDSVVTTVRYQVLDIKAMNAFLQKHRQHWTLKADSKLIETME